MRRGRRSWGRDMTDRRIARGVSMPAWLWDALDAEARRRDMTASSLIRELVRERYEWASGAERG